MSGVAVNAAVDPVETLGLPVAARLSERLTKKMLVDQAAAHPADAALITKAVALATIVGILRPETIQVPAYRDADRLVGDIPVLHVRLSDKTSPTDQTRLAELVHRSMARPVILLLTYPNGRSLLSLALTHVNQTDPARATSVIDHALILPLPDATRSALRLDRLDRGDLWALYRDLVRVAAADGRPASSALTADEAVVLRRRLAALETELATVVRDAKREKSHAGRIRLNAQARALREQIETAGTALYNPATPCSTTDPQLPNSRE